MEQTPPNLLELKPYDGFLDLCKSPHTKDNYQQDLRNLKLYLDEKEITDPTQAGPEDLIRFAGSLAKPGLTPSGKTRKAYSTRSMKRILASTRSFYKYLFGLKKIKEDPTIVFYNLSIKSPQRNPRPLPASERKTLVENLKTSLVGDLKISLSVLLGYHCGLRVSEIASLLVRDLDLKQGLVRVIGKGDKERIVPTTDQLLDLLKKYIPVRPDKESPYLFSSPRDKERPINSDHLEAWVKIAAGWSGMDHPEEMTVHVLRHSFGTQLAESGASVYEIRDLMGHSSILVSENYVKLASTKATQAHKRAFGASQVIQHLQVGRTGGAGEVLKRFRSI